MSKKQVQKTEWRSKRVGLITLGCARNTVDSEKILTDVKRRGAVICPVEQASTVILNTCGFTQEAKAESLKVLSDLVGLKRKGRIREIVVSGCLAQRYRRELAEHFQDVDVFGGLADFKDFFDPATRLTPSYTAYLKIAEGCVNRCSFCAIPLIKGPLCSRPISDILKEARFLDAQAVRELNIVGQDITLYGREKRGRVKGPLPLAKLIREILEATSVPWVRLLYLYPCRVTEDLIDLMASEPRLCPYIDLPLQHANDRILNLMNRGMVQKEIVALIDKIRRKIPGVALRTSLIVGFPSETKKEFRELCDFVARIRFDRLGVFAYSREEGTRAYGLKGQIAQKIKQERVHEIMALQEGVSRENLKRLVGQTLDVLMEARSHGAVVGTGRTRRDAPEVDGVVTVRSDRPVEPGEIISCRITGSSVHDLKGVACG
jgi:ribosomal protein S12 methylthiotransferase